MAMTLNGYIAKENNETPWSKIEWDNFREIISRVGNLIIGRKTYEIMKEGKEFENIGNPVTVVVTNQKIENSKNFTFVKSPEDAIKFLEEKEFSEVLVAGGGELNTSFMQENLIDEIYLDVAPIIFGKGIKLFSGKDFETKLELVKIKNISPNEIQLHYKIKK